MTTKHGMSRISRSSRRIRFSFPEASELLALARRRAGLARVRLAWSVCPSAQRSLGQIDVARDGPDRRALVDHQPHGLGLEVVIELPAAAAGAWACLPSAWTSYPPFGRCP